MRYNRVVVQSWIGNAKGNGRRAAELVQAHTSDLTRIAKDFGAAMGDGHIAHAVHQLAGLEKELAALQEAIRSARGTVSELADCMVRLEDSE